MSPSDMSLSPERHYGLEGQPAPARLLARILERLKRLHRRQRHVNHVVGAVTFRQDVADPSSLEHRSLATPVNGPGAGRGRAKHHDRGRVPRVDFVGDRLTDHRYPDHVSLGALQALADGFRNLVRFTDRTAYATAVVAD